MSKSGIDLFPEMRSLFQDLADLQRIEGPDTAPEAMFNDPATFAELAKAADRARRKEREAEQAAKTDRLRRFAAGEPL